VLNKSRFREIYDIDSWCAWRHLQHHYHAQKFSGIASWSHVNSVQNCVLKWPYAKFRTFHTHKKTALRNRHYTDLRINVFVHCRRFMLHSTQRSRDKLSTEGRLRPNTEPTYLLLRRQTVNGGLLDHFDNYFAEIASVHKYQTRLASLQKYYLPRMKTSLG